LGKTLFFGRASATRSAFVPTATPALGDTFAERGIQPVHVQCAIEDSQATLDNETGQVRLVVDLMIAVTGANSYSILHAVMFQVTTLAMV